MNKFDYNEVAGGVLLVATGGAVSITAIINYPLGTLSRMGPGMFPAGLGGLLAFFGVLLVIQSLRAEGEGEKPDIRIFSPLFVLGSVAVFALLVSLFGLIPAIVGITVVSSLSELRIRLKSLSLLCLTLCILAPGVFKFGLGLNIPLIAWPF